MEALLADRLRSAVPNWVEPLMRQHSSDSSEGLGLSLSLFAQSTSSPSFSGSDSLHLLVASAQPAMTTGLITSQRPLGKTCDRGPGSGGESEHNAVHLLASSSSWQAKILKVINSFHNKEELLAYVSTCHAQLDDINLVTVIYRLARMFSTVRSPAARWRWSNDLQGDTTFQQLLGAVKTHLLTAQLHLMCKGAFKGLDARGVSNLIWAITKLELAVKPGCLGHQLVQLAVPIVLRILPSSSSQGLANLLWAYSKMPVLMLKVMMAIAGEMAVRLEKETGRFDAQALSNSIWALAHIRMTVADMDAAAGPNGQGLTHRFMLGIAVCALAALSTLRTPADTLHMQAAMLEAERRFSAQALVNICWSFASLLGEECSRVPAIRTLFLAIRAEALVRLQGTATALQLGQAWATQLQGGFNEQALSNIIYAFDKAQLLDAELLQLVYDVAALRLDNNQGLPPAFKPQELCTLLRATHSNIAAPWRFLAKVHAMVTAFPHLVQPWSAAERVELERALALLDAYRTTRLLQQLQVDQQRVLQDQLAALVISSQIASPPGAMPVAWL